MTEQDLQLQALATGLVQHFRHVAETRMADVPIVNPALAVEAVGFEHTPSGYLGILITPWFMNLMLLPREGEDWKTLTVGSAVQHAFASGDYVFQVCSNDAIGRYQACSLLSPLLEIPDQSTAVEVARAALDALHDPRQRDTATSSHAAEVQRRWYDAEGGAAPTDTEDAESGKPTDAVTISRRAFLGGRLFEAPEVSR